MLPEVQKGDKEDEDLRLLEESLPKMTNGKRAYLKGAAEALLYAQEGEKENLHCSEDK